MGRKLVALIVSFWVIPISLVVNQIVPHPYMDEIFHVPQAQQYCKGNFWSWDPMITTPPGLYFLSLAHVACLFPGMFLAKLTLRFSDACSTAILRSTNGVLAVLCSIVVYDIIIHLRPTLHERKATLFAVVLSLYPLHWFFSFLYYTDVASLTAVLAMYLACLKKKYYFSALLGGFAVFVRQTNIVWVVFVACSGVIDFTLINQRKKVKKKVKVDELNEPGNGNETRHLIPRNAVMTRSNMRRPKPSQAAYGSIYPTISVTTTHTGFLDEIREICLTSWHMKQKFIISFSPFFILMLAFLAFVRWNGSIVLGAKEAHAVSLHFAQMMYFSLISTLAIAPLHFSYSHFSGMFRLLWKNSALSICQWLVALVAGFICVHFFSIAHPYLLADNRHYTFYLWRKVIKVHWLMKYLLVPVYVFSWFSIFTILGKGRSKLWLLAYFLATASVLVPAPLIEFRYYTIPFYILILHSHVSDYQGMIFVGLIYLAINSFTMIMFLFRPFYWSHEPGIQRFIW